MKRIEVRISGTVQGVFFRASAKECAEQNGLSGWAKNMPDGSVEVVAEGSEEGLEALLSFLKKGPSGASVDSIEVEWGSALGEKGFSVC